MAYQGWEPCGSKKFRTVGKTVHSGLCSGEEFWQDFSVSIASRYDLACVEEFILGGDGASWIRGGELLPFKRFQLDRFHLKKGAKDRPGIRKREGQDRLPESLRR